MRQTILSSLVILVAFAVAGCSAAAPVVKDSQAIPEDASMTRQRVNIDGNDVYEDCFELKAGQGIEYSFSSDGELNYNLHWHTDSHNVRYEVRETGVRSGKGIFTSEQEEYYCLMWQNKGQFPVSLSFSTTIK